MSEPASDRPATHRAEDPGIVAGWLAWWRAQGPATQGVVPGAYAWAVTVAPVGWTAGAPVPAALATAVGLAALFAGPVLERRAPTAGRAGLGWGLVAAAATTWAFAPEASVDAFDAARGISGMFGWALFAFAVASPARQATVTQDIALLPRRKAGRLDAVILLVGLGLAIALEIPGWRATPRDRALLVRLVAVAGGLGLVTTASAIVVALHTRERRPARPTKLRLGGVLWLAASCILLGAGVTYRLWGGG